MINSNISTVTLDGNETAVEFSIGYSYYFVTNEGNADIYVSVHSGIKPEADGVYAIPAGGTVRIGEGYGFNKFYLFGTGKAQVQGSRIAVIPYFNRAGKGGENGGTPEVDLTGYVQNPDGKPILSEADIRLHNNVMSSLSYMFSRTALDGKKSSMEFSIPMAATYSAGAMSASDKQKLDMLLLPETTVSESDKNVPTSKAVSNYVANELDNYTPVVPAATDTQVGGIKNSIYFSADGDGTARVKSLEMTNLGNFGNKTLGELKTAIINWQIEHNTETFLSCHFVGDLSFTDTEWANDNTVVKGNGRYQLTTLGGFYYSDTTKFNRQYLVSSTVSNSLYVLQVSQSNVKKPIRFYGENYFPMATDTAVGGIKSGGDITVASDGKTTVNTSTSLPSYVGKTVGEAKTDALEQMKLNFTNGRIAPVIINGLDIIRDWDNESHIIQNLGRVQFTPIGGYSDLVIDGVQKADWFRFLMTGYHANMPLYIGAVKNGNYDGSLERIYTTANPPDITEADKAKLDSITPEMLEKLKNL